MLNGKKKACLHAYQSADGIHWSKMTEEAAITAGSFDSQNLAFWDAVALFAPGNAFSLHAMANGADDMHNLVTFSREIHSMFDHGTITIQAVDINGRDMGLAPKWGLHGSDTSSYYLEFHRNLTCIPASDQTFSVTSSVITISPTRDTVLGPFFTKNWNFSYFPLLCGDRIRIHTADPVNRPLPHPGLWALFRFAMFEAFLQETIAAGV